MKVERTFLVRVHQVYEGDYIPPSDWPIDRDWLESDQDQFICDNWKLISDENELLDNDELDTRVVES